MRQYLQYQVHTEPVSTSPESVTEDRWHQPWSEPIVKIKQGLRTGDQQFFAFEPQPEVSFGWMEELSKPQTLQKRGIAAPNQQFFAYQDDPTTVTPFAWFAPLNDPVRVKLGLRAGLQQFFAADTTPIPTGRLLQWFANLSEPVRQKIGLKAALQQFLAHPPQLRPTPTRFAALNATETPDVFLGGVTDWNRISSGEAGVVVITAPGSEVSTVSANTATPIASASVSIVIV